jgi:hypothetical protein
LCSIESQVKKELCVFFEETAVPFFQNDMALAILKQYLPELDYKMTPNLMSLLPTKVLGEDWRLGVIGLMLQLLPTDFVEKALQKSTQEILTAMDQPGVSGWVFGGYLTGIGFHKNENSVKQSLLFFANLPNHQLWGKSMFLEEILRNLPLREVNEILMQLLKHENHLKSTDNTVFKYLKNLDIGSATLLIAFLEAIKRLQIKMQAWELPMKEYEAIINSAACKMSLADIEDVERNLLTLRDVYPSFRKELERFTDILKIRREFRASL